MFFYSIIFLLIIICINFLFYIPILIHLYLDEKNIYLSLFSIFLIKIDDKDNINLLKNKIDINKSNKSDYKVINQIIINKIYICVVNDIAIKYPYIIYPLFSINSKKINFQIDNKNKFYICLKIKLVNILYSLIKERVKK